VGFVGFVSGVDPGGDSFVESAAVSDGEVGGDGVFVEGVA